MVAYGLQGILQLQAQTPAAGYTLVNGTGTIASWTAPSDGQPHEVLAILEQSVTSAETGGAIHATFTSPNGTAGAETLWGGGSGAGASGNLSSHVIEPGSTFTITQASALTAGAATLWAYIWGE